MIAHIFKTPTWLAPIGWFTDERVAGVTTACSIKCMLVLDTPESNWQERVGVRQRGKTPDKCQWCQRLGRLCPGHTAQARKAGAV